MIPARQPYTRPEVPKVYQPAWWSTQLANITRSIPGRSRIVLSESTLLATDDLSVIYVDATGGDFTFHLLPPDQVQFITFWIVQRSTGNVTIGGTISGVANPLVGGQYAAQQITTDGTAYYLLSQI